MRTEDLIVALASSSGAVAPIAPAEVRWARWLAVTIAVVGCAVLVEGARVDLGGALARPGFLAAGIALVAGATAAAWVALQMAIPGRPTSSLVVALPVLANLAWMALLSAGLPGTSPWMALANEPPHAGCAANIAIIALVPAAILFLMVRRAAPLRRWRNAAAASCAAVWMGGLGAQIVCPIDRAAHLVLWHVVPVHLAACIGILVAARSFGVVVKVDRGTAN